MLPTERSDEESRLIPRLFLPLILCRVFFLLSFCHVLLAPKRTKRPGTRKNQSSCALFRNCMQYPSVAQALPLQSFLLFVGCCGTRFARLYKKIYTRASLKQSSHNGRQTAGIYVVILSVPVIWRLVLLVECNTHR